MKFRHAIVAVMALSGLAACELPAPYVDRPYAINRDAAGFPDGPALKAGSEVKVCYAKSTATPQEIRKLAVDECGRFGLGAVLVKQNYTVCPLSTPITAVFECRVATAATTSTGTIPSAGVQMPSVSAPRPAGAGVGRPGLGAADVSTTAKSAPFPTYLFNPGAGAQ